MKTLTLLLFLAFCTLVSTVEASHGTRSPTSRRHIKVRSRGSHSMSRRCAARSSKASAKDQVQDSNLKQLNAGSSQNQQSGLISVSSSQCGQSGATKDTTQTTGPNGSIDWLNCGLEGAGWKPPHVTVDQIKSVPLSEAIKSPNTPFKPCSDYVPLFEKYAGEHGFSSSILAAFAMQESSCNPHTVGGAGEQGLMQLTHDKCTAAPGGNCQDPDYNIKTGAQFFADTLKANNGDFLLSVGQYNGWSSGLTMGKATAAANTGCCRCQNNLDYLHQFVNGWLQNINVYGSQRYGKYFNLDKCGN